MRALTIALALAAATAAAPAAAATYVFRAVLDGPSEAPPNASPGTGLALVVFDDVAHTMLVEAEFSGLVGTTTAAHIHGPTANPGEGTAGVMTTTPTFPGFPGGVTGGTYLNTFNMTLASSYNPSFVTDVGGTAAAEAVLFGALLDGKAYFNIHTGAFPGGEIRGFLSLVPEPGTWALMIAGFGLTGAALRARRRAPACVNARV